MERDPYRELKRVPVFQNTWKVIQVRPVFFRQAGAEWKGNNSDALALAP